MGDHNFTLFVSKINFKFKLHVISRTEPNNEPKKWHILGSRTIFFFFFIIFSIAAL